MLGSLVHSEEAQRCKSYPPSSSPPPWLSIPSLRPLGWFQNLHPHPILSLNSESARSVLIPACWNWGPSRSQIRDFWCNSGQDSSSALQPGIVSVCVCLCAWVCVRERLCTCCYIWAYSCNCVAAPGERASPLLACVFGWKVFRVFIHSHLCLTLARLFLMLREGK